MMARWLPHPVLSLCLLGVWLLLVNDFSAGHWLLGAFLGWSIPLLTRVFWVQPPRLVRPLKLVPFLLLILGDIVVANLQVVRLVLGPKSRLNPAFVEVPVEIEDEFVLAVLACIISLTPGTVSAGLSSDHKTLLLHGLDVPDHDALIAEIKSRYEAPLLEIFECSRT